VSLFGRPMYYRLDEHRNPVPLDANDWAAHAAEFAKDRRVALTHVGGKRVSTVFLVLDHGFSDTGPPLVFETMVFAEGSSMDEYCERYATWDEAVAGHARAVMELRKEDPT
jgi:hypothetical protein